MEDWQSFGKSYVMTLRCWLDRVKDWQARDVTAPVTYVTRCCWFRSWSVLAALFWVDLCLHGFTSKYTELLVEMEQHTHTHVVSKLLCLEKQTNVHLRVVVIYIYTFAIMCIHILNIHNMYIERYCDCHKSVVFRSLCISFLHRHRHQQEFPVKSIDVSQLFLPENVDLQRHATCCQ